MGIKPPNDVSPMPLKHIGQEVRERSVGHIVKLCRTIVRALVGQVQHLIMMQIMRPIIFCHLNTIGDTKITAHEPFIHPSKQLEIVCSPWVNLLIGFTQNIVLKAP